MNIKYIECILNMKKIKKNKNSVKFVKIKIFPIKYLKLKFIVHKMIMHFIDKILFKKKEVLFENT